jgi:hypothetical protein
MVVEAQDPSTYLKHLIKHIKLLTHLKHLIKHIKLLTHLKYLKAVDVQHSHHFGLLSCAHLQTKHHSVLIWGQL